MVSRHRKHAPRHLAMASYPCNRWFAQPPVSPRQPKRPLVQVPMLTFDQPCSSLSSCLCEILSTRAARGADVGASEHMIGAVSALTLSTAAFAQQGPQEARAMLDKAIAAVKADPVVAIAMFIKGEGGVRDRDLYPFCFRIADGKTLASPKAVPAGTDVRSLKDATGNSYGHPSDHDAQFG